VNIIFNKIKINIFLIILSIVLIAGCSNKDDSTFYSETNFEDKTKILEVIENYKNGINSQNIYTIMSSFSKDFAMPDYINKSIVHTYPTIQYDFINFFNRSSSVFYSLDDVFLTINEKNCKANFKLLRQFTGHAPFNYNVNDEEYETLYLEKTEEGKWIFSTISHRLLPPIIEDLD
jgi:hypothetical protein